MNYQQQIRHAKKNATTHTPTLINLGYRQIGRGAFSRVFVHPDAPDVVIKVGTYQSTKRYVQRRNLEDAFPTFARICLTARSKFYPKVYHVEEDGNSFVVVMKRYYPNRHRKVKETINGTAVTLSTGSRPNYLSCDMRRFSRALKPLTGYVLDLHSKNIMQDHDGTPILTDPIAIRRYA